MEKKSVDQRRSISHAEPAVEGMSKSRHERVGQEQAGQRIDNFLIRQCPGVPRSHIYQMIRKGDVRVDGKRVKQTRKLLCGEQVRIPAVRIKTPQQVAVPARLSKLMQSSVLYENDDFLIINKPAGVAVHAGSGLAFGVIDAIRQQRNDNSLELSHRLDRATSGCLLIGKGLKANRKLQDLFRNKLIEKHYLALVAGHWPAQIKEVSAPLLKNVQHAGERRVMVDARGQSARTCYSIKTRYPGATMLNVALDTGRTHQIRVHCKHVGHAVVGDTRYGDNKKNSTFKNQGLNRLYLHSVSLAFKWDKVAISVRAPTDAQWNSSLAKLKPINTQARQ